MSTLAEESEAQEAVARLSFQGIQDGQELVDVYVEAGGVARLNGCLISETDGILDRPLPTGELFEAWSRLRRVMSRPNEGAWLTGRLRVKADGRYSFDFEWDAEPRWPTVVGLDGAVVDGDRPMTTALLRDFEMYPRGAGSVPTWFEAIENIPRPQFEDREWPRTLGAFQSERLWQIIATEAKRTLSDAVLDGDFDHVEPDEVADALTQELLEQMTSTHLRALLGTVAQADEQTTPFDWSSVNEGANAREVLLAHPELMPAFERVVAVAEELVTFEMSALTAR